MIVGDGVEERLDELAAGRLDALPRPAVRPEPPAVGAIGMSVSPRSKRT